MLKIPADLILLKGGVLVRWSTCWRLEAIYFTSFDFDYHESKLAHVHHILDKFSFN